MTPKERAAMQQALKALEEAYAAQFETTWFEIKPEHFTAPREALAEPDIEEMTLTQIAARHKQAEQEPVAWALTSENGEVLDCISHTYKVTQPCTVDYGEPLYAAPVRTKDLTDDEIMKINVDTAGIVPTCDRQFHFARAVIAADREKNK